MSDEQPSEGSQNPQQPAGSDMDSTEQHTTEQNETEQHETAESDSSEGEQSADTAGAEQEQQDPHAEADKWKALARKHERENSKTRRELDELREQVSSHENAVTEAHHALASERLHTKLARAGMPEEDASALIEHIDPQRLVEDGKPSTKAIESVAASLSRSLTRGVDEDQGQASESPSISADQWLRKKARK